MTSTTIWDRVRQKPFTPFRLHVSDGNRYEVLHPEMIFVAKQSITIGLYERGRRVGEEPASRVIVISPLHVTSVEDMPQRATGGPKRRSA